MKLRIFCTITLISDLQAEKIMTRIPASEARLQFAELVNKVAFGSERILLHRHGKDVAAIVSVDDLRLLEDLENKMDLEAARAALKEKAPRIAWKRLKEELALSGDLSARLPTDML